MGVKPSDLHHRSRTATVSQARKAFAYLGHRKLGIPSREIAEYLHVTALAASQMLEEGRGIAERARLSVRNN